MNKRKGPSFYIRIKSKNTKLILKGLKYISETEKSKTEFQKYNKYKYIVLLSTLTYSIMYIKDKYLRFEYEKYNKPNFLIPEFIYRIREEHYIYWEKSRLARGLSTTFSYYIYDEESKMMTTVDCNGMTKVEKLIFKSGLESKAMLSNPLMEIVYKEKTFNERLANEVSTYYMNITNRNDLKSYLLYKPITVMDIIRAVYNKTFICLGLVDSYRNEQYLSKSDFFYNIEKLVLNGNLNQSDLYKARGNLFIILWYCFVYCYCFIKRVDF